MTQSTTDPIPDLPETHPELESLSTAKLLRQGRKLRQECADLEARAAAKRTAYLAVADEVIRVREEGEVAPIAREWGMTFQNLRKQLGAYLWTPLGFSPDRRGTLVTRQEKAAALTAAGWSYDEPTSRWTPPDGGAPVLLLAAWGRLQRSQEAASA